MNRILYKASLLAAALFIVQVALAQTDTLKVGLNDQLIQVDAPEGGQKITVLIEDSTFTYKVEISKLENKSLDDKIKDFALGAKRDKYAYSSTWFKSAEVGYNTAVFKTFYTPQNSLVNLILNDSTGSVTSDVNYTRRSFSSDAKSWGAYLDYTIRERKKPSKRIKNLYLKRKSHIRLDFNTIEGNLHFDNYIGSGDILRDSFLSGTFRTEKVSFTNLQLSQLLTYGYEFNADKDISVEYGVNVGLQFALSETNNERSVNIGADNSLNSFTLFDKYVANPFMRVQHHAAYNCGPYSLNAKLTYLGKRFGSNEKNHVYAHILSLGVGYKF